jgi:hypothetical protein
MSLPANKVVIKFATKTFIGLTSHNFNISPEIRTAITRDGTTKEKVRFPYSGSIEAVAEVTTGATLLNRNDAVTMVLAKTPVAIIYIPAVGAQSYSGAILITGFDEKAGADDNVTFSLNFEDDGTPLIKTT